MAGITPRYESITGASLSGIDGATSRTYTLTNANYSSVIDFVLGTTSLVETTNFTVVNGLVTFVGVVNNTDVISLRYFTSDAAASVVAGYGYASTANVYMTSGITSTEISTIDVANQIARAETIICRMTKNIYWNIAKDNQTATSGSANTIVETGAGWTVNEFVGLYVWVYSGTGSVQLRKIISNTSDTLTVDRDWTTTNPAVSSKFRIFYVPSDFTPYISDSYDGSGLSYMYLPYYPVKKLETLSVGATPVVVTPSNVYIWEKTGKLQFKNIAEASVFSRTYPQEVTVSYWYGVDTLPLDIKRLVEIHASMQILAQQMGGTFDDPSSVSLPEATVTVGQAYINIRSSLETLKEEYTELLKQVKIWPVFAY